MLQKYNFVAIVICLVLPKSSCSKDEEYAKAILDVMSSAKHCGWEMRFVISSKDKIPTESFFLRAGSMFEINLLDMETLKNFNSTTFHERIWSRKRCVAVLCEEEELPLALLDFDEKLHKDNESFKPSIFFVVKVNNNMPDRNRKPEEQRIQDLLRPTKEFLVDTDTFLVFIYGNDGNDAVLHKSSVWEMYNCKGIVFSAKIECPHPIANCYLLNHAVERRSNFHGLEFSGTLFDRGNGWLNTEKAEDGRQHLAIGFGTWWYWDLQKMLNIKLKIIIPPKDSLDPDYKDQGEDLYIGLVLLTKERAKLVTFLHPVYSTLIYVFFQQPKPNSIRNILTAPFETPLWIATISTWACIGVVMKLTHQKSYTSQPIGNNDGQFVGSSLFLWIIAANCQKSWQPAPKSTKVKFIFIVGFLFGTLLYTAYSAEIISFLTTPVVPVKRFADLILKNFLLTVHIKSKPFQDLLWHIIQTYNLKQGAETVTSEVEISHLLNEDYPKKAFLSYQDLFYRVASEQNYTTQFLCRHISKMTLNGFRYKIAMYAKKGSEYREILNYKLITLMERGFSFRYVNSYEEKTVPYCASDNEKTQVEIHPIKVSDICIPQLLIWIGFVLSFTLVLVERRHRTKTPKKEQGTLKKYGSQK